MGRLVSCLLHRALFSYEDYQYLDMYQPLHNHCQMVYLLEKHFEMSMKLTSTISTHSDNFSCNVHWVIPPNYAHKQRRRVDITSPIVYELEFYGHILNWQKKNHEFQEPNLIYELFVQNSSCPMKYGHLSFLLCLVSDTDTTSVLRFIFWTLLISTCPCCVWCPCQCRCFIDLVTFMIQIWCFLILIYKILVKVTLSLICL